MSTRKLIGASVLCRVPVLASVTLDMPPSANSLFFNVRGRGRARTSEYRGWSDAASWAIRTQRMPFFAGRVGVSIRAGRPKRVRDLDNLAKPILDALTSCRVIEDDILVRSLSIEWDEGVEDGAVLVTVRAL